MEYASGHVIHQGNRELYKLIKISLLGTYLGYPQHLHAEGVRGTGKTSLFRNISQQLPKIRRIKNCPYNCFPHKPHCPQHRELNSEQVAEIGEEWVPMPFMEISHGAKIGTVLGSIDLKKITDHSKPLAGILPGTIPKAHRGIIFVDEINRLADTSPELTDVLLDVMGTKPGKVQIEETGLSKVELPVNVTVWAASNPDEDPGSLANIRKQLSDRFDFATEVLRPGHSEVVESIIDDSSVTSDESLNQDQNHDQDQNQDQDQDQDQDQEKIFSCPRFWRYLDLYEQPLHSIELSRDLKTLLAQVYLNYKIESLRAVKAMKNGAVCHAILTADDLETDSINVRLYDLLQLAGPVLYHRVSGETKRDILRYMENWGAQDNYQVNRNSIYRQIQKENAEQGRGITGSSQGYVKQLLNKIKKSMQKPTKGKITTTDEKARSLADLSSDTETSDELVTEGERKE